MENVRVELENIELSFLERVVVVNSVYVIGDQKLVLRN